jgi:hypothetical protein
LSKRIAPLQQRACPA